MPKGGTLTNWVKRLFDEQKFQKLNIILEGSWHPNFMNPFEYGKSFLDKFFPKRCGQQLGIFQYHFQVVQFAGENACVSAITPSPRHYWQEMYDHTSSHNALTRHWQIGLVNYTFQVVDYFFYRFRFLL